MDNTIKFSNCQFSIFGTVIDHTVPEFSDIDRILTQLKENNITISCEIAGEEVTFVNTKDTATYVVNKLKQFSDFNPYDYVKEESGFKFKYFPNVVVDDHYDLATAMFYIHDRILNDMTSILFKVTKEGTPVAKVNVGYESNTDYLLHNLLTAHSGLIGNVYTDVIKSTYKGTKEACKFVAFVDIDSKFITAKLVEYLAGSTNFILSGLKPLQLEYVLGGGYELLIEINER